MIGDSFFDDDRDDKQNGYSIWKKSPDGNIIDTPPLEDILYKGYLGKSESKSKSTQQRYFILTRDKLYYKQRKSATGCKAYLECRFMRLKIFLYDEVNPAKPQDKLRLRFVRNLKFTDLYAKDLEQLENWIKVLGTTMIRTDFHERYKVKKLLGEGAFAKVYFAERIEDSREFAVKVLSKEFLSKLNKGRFAIRNEIDTLMDLDHPNIVKLHEAHETQNHLYLVCSYLSGGTLTDLLKRNIDYLPDESVVTIMQ